VLLSLAVARFCLCVPHKGHLAVTQNGGLIDYTHAPKHSHVFRTCSFADLSHSFTAFFLLSLLFFCALSILWIVVWNRATLVRIWKLTQAMSCLSVLRSTWQGCVTFQRRSPRWHTLIVPRNVPSQSLHWLQHILVQRVNVCERSFFLTSNENQERISTVYLIQC
jgi:hypothetical protein